MLVGCAAAPPQTITLAPGLHESVAIAAARARDAWCAAPVDWCPELVDSGGDAQVIVQAFTGQSWDSRMNNSGETIKVQANIVEGGADYLTGAMVHEFGHFGIDGHVPRSPLMKARFDLGEDIPWTVDSLAAAEWCKQQGC